jgi:hypothetical protein
MANNLAFPDDGDIFSIILVSAFKAYHQLEPHSLLPFDLLYIIEIIIIRSEIKKK